MFSTSTDELDCKTNGDNASYLEYDVKESIRLSVTSDLSVEDKRRDDDDSTLCSDDEDLEESITIVIDCTCIVELNCGDIDDVMYSRGKELALASISFVVDVVFSTELTCENIDDIISLDSEMFDESRRLVAVSTASTFTDVGVTLSCLDDEFCKEPKMLAVVSTFPDALNCGDSDNSTCGPKREVFKEYRKVDVASDFCVELNGGDIEDDMLCLDDKMFKESMPLSEPITGSAELKSRDSNECTLGVEKELVNEYL